MGVRYWAQHYVGPVVPKYHVFRVFGYSPTNGHYFFQSHKDPQVIVFKSYYQLGQNGFLPFLIQGGRNAHVSHL